MRDGTPEQIAPPRTVYREPSSRFVAEFVGDNNVFVGRVVDVEGETWTTALPEPPASTWAVRSSGSRWMT